MRWRARSNEIILTQHEMVVIYNLYYAKRGTVALLSNEKKQLSDFLGVEVLVCFFFTDYLFYFKNHHDWYIAEQETQMDELLGHFNEN